MTVSLPGDWTMRRIGDVCQVVGRIGYRGYTVDDIVPEGHGAIAISPSNIVDGRITFDKCTYVSWRKWAESPEIQVVEGDILLVKTGSTVGKTAMVRGLPTSATLNPQVVVLKRRRVDDVFLGYVLASRVFQNQLAATVVGGALPTLSQREVASYMFPCPKDPAEQSAIGAALSDADALIASLEVLITKKQAIKHGMTQRLLTGKTRLPGFTSEWVDRELWEMAVVDPENLPAGTSPGEVIDYISLEDVNRGELLGSSQLTFRNAPSRARRVVRQMDVLFGTVRPNLQSHLIYVGGLPRPVASTGFAVIRALAGQADPRFVFYLVMSHLTVIQIDRIIAGSNYPAVSSGDVRSLRFKIPDLPEQVAIGAILADCDAELAALRQRLTKAKAVKQGMIQELLTGFTRLPVAEVMS